MKTYKYITWRIRLKYNSSQKYILSPKISSELSKKWVKKSSWFDSVDEVPINDAITAEENDGWDPSADIPKEQYSPSYRETMRRHKAEKRFFNPSRSKKSNELDALTSSIITHRYNASETVVPSTDLVCTFLNCGK